MYELADQGTIQFAILFPFIPLVCVAIVTYILGYDTRDDDNDDDDDDKGMLQLAWSRA